MAWNIFSSAAEYPKAVLGEEEGFIDISLSISKYETLGNGTKRFIVKNTLNGQKVSFILDLLPEWAVKPIENMDANFYWGSATITSTGLESDAFLRQVAKLYNMQDSVYKFKNSISAQVVGLASNPEEIDSSPVKMKFFLNPDADESLYSEIFINIDLKENTLEFNEKDPDYRGPLVHSMAQ